MAERLVYAASAGVIVCLVAAAAAVARHFRVERVALIVACAAVCVLAGRTWARNWDWQDDLSLARATVAASPNSFKAHQMMAEALYLSDPEHRNLDGVIVEAERGIAILNPLPDQWNSPELYRLAGDCYLQKNEPAKALPVLQRGAAILQALRAGRTDLAPSVNDDLYRLLSAAESRLGRVTDAVAAAREGVKHDALRPGMWEQLAAAHRAAGDRDSAESALLEGMLVTSDMGLRQQLLELYRSEACALTAGPAGAAINPACPAVHRQMCAVAADTIRISLTAGRQQQAASLKESMLRDYGCPAGPILEAMPN